MPIIGTEQGGRISSLTIRWMVAVTGREKLLLLLFHHRAVIRALPAFPQPDRMESFGIFPEAFNSRHIFLGLSTPMPRFSRQISKSFETKRMPD